MENKTPEEKQRYCITCKDRYDGWTRDISGPMSKAEADAWKPSSNQKKFYTYFRVSKYPFRAHLKK